MSALAGLLVGLAVLVLLAPADAGRLQRAVPARPGPGGLPRGDRARGDRAPGDRAPADRSPAGRVSRRVGVVPAPVLAGGLAGIALALVLPFPLGAVAGAVAAVAGPRLVRRLEPRAVRAEREQLLADLPLVLDLLAACLAGGAPLAAAAAAVGEAVRGPAGRRLSAVSAALHVGSAPADAWHSLATGGDGDPLLPAARALSRAADGGAPVAAAVARLAAEARADARGRGERAARQVGVRAVAPLGLCFLPAFVLLGIVPVVVGLAGPLLSAF